MPAPGAGQTGASALCFAPSSLRSCPLQFGGGCPSSFNPDETARVVGRVDDEDERVVERVVLRLAALVGEIDTKMQPAVRERRPLDIEAELRAAVPAQLGGRNGACGDEDPGVVPKLPAEP